MSNNAFILHLAPNKEPDSYTYTQKHTQTHTNGKDKTILYNYIHAYVSSKQIIIISTFCMAKRFIKLLNLFPQLQLKYFI